MAPRKKQTTGPSKPAAKADLSPLLRWCWREIMAYWKNAEAVTSTQLVRALDRAGVAAGDLYLQELAGVVASISKFTRPVERDRDWSELTRNKSIERRVTLIRNSLCLLFVCWEEHVGQMGRTPLRFKQLRSWSGNSEPLWIVVKGSNRKPVAGMAFVNGNNILEPAPVRGCPGAYNVDTSHRDEEYPPDAPVEFSYDGGDDVAIFRFDHSCFLDMQPD